MRNQNNNNNQNSIFNMMTGNLTPSKGFSINNSYNNLNNIINPGKRKQTRSKTPPMGGRIINFFNNSSNALIEASRDGNNSQHNQTSLPSNKSPTKINENKNSSKNQSGLTLGKVYNHINNSFNLNGTYNIANKRVATPNNKNVKSELRNFILMNRDKNNYAKKFMQKNSVEVSNSKKGDRLSGLKDRSLNNVSNHSNNSGPNENSSQKNRVENISVPFLNITSTKNNPIAAGNNLSINVSNVNINVNNNINSSGNISNNNALFNETNASNNNNLNVRKIINDDRKFSILDIGCNAPLYVGEITENQNGKNNDSNNLDVSALSESLSPVKRRGRPESWLIEKLGSNNLKCCYILAKSE